MQPEWAPGACAARKAAINGAEPFATSPALLQSAALGETVRYDKNPGLARSSLRPGLTPAGLWPTMPAIPTMPVIPKMPLRPTMPATLSLPLTRANLLPHQRHHRCLRRFSLPLYERPAAAPTARRTQPRAGRALASAALGPMHATHLAQGRALNGRRRVWPAGDAAMLGADLFVTSPALLQSAALGGAVRCHKTQGLLVPRSSLG